ncbi:MAG: FHA domain-containing protein [Myxococcales bacterium]|nr:FHA domain-containing protein [Myxococcales bacterium]
MRVFLEYQEGSVQLPVGETVVGRNVDCALRFNDPFVSRRHVRIVVTDEAAFVEELASRNGTWLNGEAFEGRRQLSDGDTIALGKRKLRVVIGADDELGDITTEATKPDSFPELSAAVFGIEDAMRDLEAPPTEPAPPGEQTCPKCRAVVAAVHERCLTCGYAFRPGRPASLTQQLALTEVDRQIEEAERRSAARHPLAVPVVYTSDTMTIDALTYDLSRAGVFIASPLLDEVGTRCQVTLLPEAAPAIPIPSVVARVNADGEPGMGIRFELPGERARKWLDEVLRRVGD